MNTPVPHLTEELQKAIHDHNGLVHVAGSDGRYVLMSMQVFREMMGVGTDEEMAESLREIEEALSDVEAGRTRPFRDVLDELGTDK